MSITTFAELQTATQTWLDRTDISTSAADFITLSEAYFNRNLRSRLMVTTSTFTTTAGSATLPTDFLAVKSLRWSGSPQRPLEPLEEDDFYARYGSGASGSPNAYMIIGSTITIAPADNSNNFNLSYYQKIPALTVSNTTNWLLTAHPDLYLAGSIAEAEIFDKNNQSGGMWATRRDSILDEINKSENFRYRATPQMRLRSIMS